MTHVDGCCAFWDGLCSQASSSNELDRLKDQMILLRRICRLRATKAHKLTRIEFEEQLSNGLNSNMQQLQQELAFMKVCGISLSLEPVMLAVIQVGQLHDTQCRTFRRESACPASHAPVLFQAMKVAGVYQLGSSQAEATTKSNILA